MEGTEAQREKQKHSCPSPEPGSEHGMLPRRGENLFHLPSCLCSASQVSAANGREILFYPSIFNPLNDAEASLQSRIQPGPAFPASQHSQHPSIPASPHPSIPSIPAFPASQHSQHPSISVIPASQHSQHPPIPASQHFCNSSIPAFPASQHSQHPSISVIPASPHPSIPSIPAFL
jgi:hypothetical protein